MPRGRLKQRGPQRGSPVGVLESLEHELVRILFDGRLRLLRLGFLSGDADTNGQRGCDAAAP